MSKLTLYDAIDAQLLAAAPSIKTRQLWNNQLLNEAEEEARQHPAAYIDFSEIVWLELTKGLAEAEIQVTIHVVIERLQTDDRTFLAIVDEVYNALQLHQGAAFTPLKRVSELQDVDHNNCIDWQITFLTKLVDQTASTTNALGTITDPDLEVTGDLDIDNDVVRAGDGVF